jgi:hypothetical protein
MAYLSGSFPDPEIDAIALGTPMRPYGELLSEQRAHEVAAGLGLAHVDANLKGSEDAKACIGVLSRTLANQFVLQLKRTQLLQVFASRFHMAVP